VWKFDDFAQHSPAEVKTEEDRYSLSLYNDNKDVNKGVVGTDVTTEKGVTTLRFSSGTVVTVTVRASDDPAGVAHPERALPR
jgi:hypothetical protein